LLVEDPRLQSDTVPSSDACQEGNYAKRWEAPVNRFANLILLSTFGLAVTALVRPAATTGEEVAARADPPELKNLKYRVLGPAWGGRVSRASGVPGDPRTYYCATAGGGVWKSSDGGTTWRPIFDDQSVSSIGSISIAASNPSVVYIGSGEANIRGNVAAGDGIYKSTDGGETWSHVWKQEGQIGTIAVDPRNPDVVFAAVLGHVFGPNPERGVYRTKDGGKTWRQVLMKDANTGASDVALSPSNPNLVFAGLWQARRLPWDLQSGGRGSGLYMSRDSGDTWIRLDGRTAGKGLPEGIWGKVGVAIAPSDGQRIYALIEAELGGLFRSDDGGNTWSRINASHMLRQRPFYFSTLSINPSNPDEIWFPQVTLLKSVDGGKTIDFVKGVHSGDFHDVWFDPHSPQRVIASNDGGVEITVDSGNTWYAPPLPLGQVYHVGVDNRLPFYVAATMQDVGTAQGPSDSLSTLGIRNSDWYEVGGGESGYIASDPFDPNTVYAGNFGGYISRFDLRKQQVHNISIQPEDMEGHYAEEMKYRFQMTAPILVSDHERNVLYHASNVLFRSEDRGQTWTAISGDLTRNDKTKQQWAGGPITGDNTGTEIYDTIAAIAESPIQQGLLWAGTDDGLVHLTRDGGKIWKNVTSNMPGMPEWGTVSMIEASRYNLGTAYVVVDAHRVDDPTAYLFKTRDFGHSWQRLDAAVLAGPLHAVREDTKQKDILYVGTERGIAFTTDGGTTWHSLKLNLPTVAIYDLAVKNNSLVVATMGRSIWSFDHLSVLRELSSQVIARRVHLFGIADTIRWNLASAHDDTWVGKNPEHGAIIYYWLKEKPKGDITIEILDTYGHIINTLSSIPRVSPGHSEFSSDVNDFLASHTLPKEEGINAAVWDLSYSGPEMIEGSKLEFAPPLLGPRVLPGTYIVRLTVDNQISASQFTLLSDPRVSSSAADLSAGNTLALSIRDDISRLTLLVREIRSVRSQLEARNELLRLQGWSSANELSESSKALIIRLDNLEAKLHNPRAEISFDILAMKGGAKLYSQLSFLFDTCIRSDDLPTEGMHKMYQGLRHDLDVYEGDMRRLESVDVTSFNERCKRLDVPYIFVRSAPRSE
jgi:photosystem II stability/assembly factor-like uncharacterized protein